MLVLRVTGLGNRNKVTIRIDVKQASSFADPFGAAREQKADVAVLASLENFRLCWGRKGKSLLGHDCQFV